MPAARGWTGVELRDINRFDPECGYMVAAAGLIESPSWGSLAVELTPDRLTARFDRALGDRFGDSFALESTGPG